MASITTATISRKALIGRSMKVMGLPARDDERLAQALLHHLPEHEPSVRGAGDVVVKAAALGDADESL